MGDGFYDLVASAEAIIDSAPGDFDVFSRIRSIFEEILERRLYIQALNDLVQRKLNEGGRLTGNMSNERLTVLHTSPVSSWGILTHSLPSEDLYLGPVHTMSALISGSNLIVDRYRSIRPLDMSVFDDGAMLELSEQRTPDEGEIFTKNGTFEALDVRTNGPEAMTLRVNTTNFAQFEWAFDRETRKAKYSSAMNRIDSNLSTILEMLASVRSSESVPHVAQLSRHPAHFIRWKAIQTMWNIDETQAKDMLADALNDPHPHVRAAARSTIAAHRAALASLQ